MIQHPYRVKMNNEQTPLNNNVQFIIPFLSISYDYSNVDTLEQDIPLSPQTTGYNDPRGKHDYRTDK